MQQRLNYAFQLCLSRSPSAKEQDVLLTMLEKTEAAIGEWLAQRAGT